ncbi:hypothetical protein D3C81_1175760 [compost metagenome]
MGKVFARGQFEQAQALVFHVQPHLGAVGHDLEQRQRIALGQALGIRGDIAQVAVDQEAGMLQLDAMIAPQLQHFEVAPAVEDVLVGIDDELVAVADDGAQGFAVGMPGQVHDDVLEVLAQCAEQHVKLGGTGLAQRVIVLGEGQQAQAFLVAGESTVDQGGVEPAQVAQGIAEIERRLQPQQRQAVAPGQAQVQQQGLLATFLDHPRQVRGQQSAVGTGLHTVQHGQAAQAGVVGDGGHAFAQAPNQPGHFTGPRAIGDEIAGAGTHGVQHQLIVHAIAQSDDRQ